MSSVISYYLLTYLIYVICYCSLVYKDINIALTVASYWLEFIHRSSSLTIIAWYSLGCDHFNMSFYLTALLVHDVRVSSSRNNLYKHSGLSSNVSISGRISL